MSLPRVVVNIDTGEMHFDGEQFPFPYAGVEPVIAESPDGKVYPGVQITIACADVQIIKPSEVIPDA